MATIVDPERELYGPRGPRTRKALSLELETQLLRLMARPAPYRIEALALDRGAPDSLAALFEATREGSATRHADAGPIRDDGTGALLGVRIPVWAGGSRHTIWSRPRINWLFRAWHDSQHILLGAEFDTHGEELVARHSVAAINGKAERAILWAETMGQVWYHERWRAFPSNQRQFVVDAVRFGLETTIDRGVYHKEGA